VPLDQHDWPLGSGSVDPTPWRGSGGTSSPMPATGRAALTHPGTGRIERGGWQTVAAWRSPDGQASPVAMMVASTAEVLTQLGNTYTAGGPTGGSGVRSELAGALRVTYGLGAVLRTFEADMRPGSYQLPPCDLAQVEAQLFGHSASPVAVEVSGALVAGLQPMPSRFTSSQRLTMFGGRWEGDDLDGRANHYTDAPPATARWVSMASSEVWFPDEGNGYALMYKQPRAGLFMLHDYTRRLFIGQPGQVSELLDHAPYAVNLITAAAVDAAGVQVLLRFYLEV